MADEKYNIDEILKEIDNSRGVGKQKKNTTQNSADLLGDTDEIDKLINSSKKKQARS